MVFYIDQTISLYAKKTSFTDAQLFVFSDLATAFQKGYCAITGHLDSIQSLVNSLGSPAKGIYTIIHGLHSQLGSILSNIPKVFVLTFDESISKAAMPPYIQEKSVFLNLADAVYWNLDLGCSLVGENLDDCKFYKLIGEKFCEHHNLKGLNIHFSFEPGGGNTTHKVFTNCVQAKKLPTLCIVDSDQKYGKFGSCQNTPSLGDTFRLVENANNVLDTVPHAAPHMLFPIHVRSVYKELHADHETGTADNK